MSFFWHTPWHLFIRYKDPLFCFGNISSKCQTQSNIPVPLQWFSFPFAASSEPAVYLEMLLSPSALPGLSAAVSLASASSPPASSSLTKLDGNSPDLPLKLPLHQPSSTCHRKEINRNHQRSSNVLTFRSVGWRNKRLLDLSTCSDLQRTKPVRRCSAL